MNHQSTYQQGYINGYLEGLLAFYNLRYKHANDYRNLEARFIQSPLSVELNQAVLTALTDLYKRSTSFQREKAMVFGGSLELKPLHIPFADLGLLLEPWLPNIEETLIAKQYGVPDDQFPSGERLTDNFLAFVLKEYGMPGRQYRFWQAVFPNALMKSFSYCADEMFTLVIENGKEMNMLHFVLKAQIQC
ncbi:MAG: hypothetical protein DI535_23735 [Citrobacter freundii]|nr:MAG: hypothetical protein DI535_23735 [Citrobacter freundii]